MIILLINKCLWVTIKIKCIECKESFCKETLVWVTKITEKRKKGKKK